TWYDMDSDRCRNSSRGICISRKARDLLIANKVCRPDDWEGIEVLDKPYKGAQVLDRLYRDRPGPLFTDDELRWIRQEEAKAWAAHEQRVRPVRAPSLPRSLSSLKARKRRDPKSFKRAATANAIDKVNKALPYKLPTVWQKVLRTANGGS